jgi:TatD DNase family protein
MHVHLDMIVRHCERVRLDVENKRQQLLSENSLKTLPEVPVVPNVSRLVEDSVVAGISGLLHCACELDDINALPSVLDTVESVPAVRSLGAIAIHPNESVLHAAGKGGHTELLQVADDGLDPPKLEQRHFENDLDDCLNRIDELLNTDARIRVVGETGLDYFRSAPIAKTVQQESFRGHIALAKKHNIPVQIHDRNAHEDVVKILLETTPSVALFHSFSGDVALAELCVANGWYASFSGPVTFKPNKDLRSAFRYIYEHAPELLLIETDAPFLTPEPNRGRTNSPAQIFHTLTFLAEMLDVQRETLCKLFSDNSSRVLNLDE